MPQFGSHSVAVALLADLRRARDHIDRNYREPLAATPGVNVWPANWLVLVEPKEFTPDDFKSLDRWRRSVAAAVV